MAHATQTVIRPIKTEAQQEAEKLAQVREQTAVDADGLIDGLKVLQAMHERGVLDLFAALFNRGDQVLERLVDIVAAPAATNTVQLLINLLQGLGKIDANAVSKSFDSLSAGMDRVEHPPERTKPIGVFGLMKQLKDPDVNAAICVGLDFLKGVGHSLRTGDAAQEQKQQVDGTKGA